MAAVSLVSRFNQLTELWVALWRLVCRKIFVWVTAKCPGELAQWSRPRYGEIGYCERAHIHFLWTNEDRVRSLGMGPLGDLFLSHWLPYFLLAYVKWLPFSHAVLSQVHRIETHAEKEKPSTKKFYTRYPTERLKTLNEKTQTETPPNSDRKPLEDETKIIIMFTSTFTQNFNNFFPPIISDISKIVPYKNSKIWKIIKLMNHEKFFDKFRFFTINF